MPPLLHRQAEAGGHRWPHREVRAPLRAPRQEAGRLTVLDPERRARLLAVKLQTLAREHLGVAGEPVAFRGGAAMVDADGRAVVLADESPARALGPALAWARQAGATSLQLLADDAAGLLARRAAAFTDPPAVGCVQGRDVHAVEPEPLGAPVPVPPDALDLAPALVAAGADVVVEHGVVAGEVLGLEIARVVTSDGALRIEAGVGRHDREAFAIVHGDLPAADALAKVVETVRRARVPGPVDHPLKRLAPERWLREVVLADPRIAGLAPGSLDRHEGPVPRPNVKEPWPAVAVGDGVVVVCSVGIDLDLVPFAADSRLAATGGHDARLVLVVPERDAHPVTRALAARLTHPAEIVTVEGDWRAV